MQDRFDINTRGLERDHGVGVVVWHVGDHAVGGGGDLDEMNLICRTVWQLQLVHVSRPVCEDV